MHRIDGPGATPANQFTEGDPQAGVAATVVTDDWLDDVQENLAGAIEGAGIALQKGDYSQLSRALATRVGTTRNRLINGDFLVAQRGTVTVITTAAPAFAADRWIADPTSGNTATLSLLVSPFTAGQVLVPGDPERYLEWTQSAGLNGSGDGTLEQRIENAWTLSNRAAVLGFWARTASGTTTVTPRLEQNFGSGGSGTITAAGSAKTLTTTWQFFSQGFAVPSVGGKTFGADHYLRLVLAIPQGFSGEVQLAEIQLEPGTVPTAFERVLLKDALAACQRFYEVSYRTSATPGQATSDGALFAYSAGVGIYGLSTRFLVRKRTNSPTITWWSLANPSVQGDVSRIDATTQALTAVSVTAQTGECDATTGYPSCAAFAEGIAGAQWEAEDEL